MSEPRSAGVTKPVIYIDEVGTPHHALVTNDWGPTCVNLLFVLEDPKRTDPYGHQIERRSSCMHASVVPVHGNYWRFVDEPAKPTEHAL